MATVEKLNYYCERCNHTMAADNFYSSNNLEKYPDGGKLKMCKKCLTARVDNWDPDTFLWILQEIDVPYIPEEWDKILAKYSKDRSKVTGLTILGRYLSKMKLKQWKDYRWKDNEFLQDLANHKIEQTMKRQGYDTQQIVEAVNKASFIIPEGELPTYQVPLEEEMQQSTEDYFDQINGFSDDDLADDLTDEDKLQLRLKWGKMYKPAEWIQLEKLYNEMMESYEINTAGHIDVLKKVCKTSLKADQLLDLGDIDGAQKMLKMYDALMKNGKFQAVQNKQETNEFVNSISELVTMCEKDGFIPRYYDDVPKDKVDYIIKDMQEYTHTLITEEMHLGSLIEKAVQAIENDRLKELEQEIDNETEEEAFERELFADDTKELTFDDYNEFNTFKEEQEELDKDLLSFLEDE